MRGSRKFCQRGSNTDNVFFLVDEGREDPSTTISGLSSAMRWRADDGHGVSLACRWRFAGVPMMAMTFRWRADDGHDVSLACR